MITTRSAAIPIVLGLATSAAPPAYAQIGPAKASELVALTNGSGSTPCPGQSNWNAVTFLPLSGTTFKIPTGNVLVITELAVLRKYPGVTNTNDFSAWLVTGGGIAGNPVATQSVTLDSNGIGGATLTIPQGIRVPSGATVCVENTTGGFRQVYAYGYLAPNQ